MLQYSPLDLIQLNTRENTKLAIKKPELRNLRKQLSSVFRKDENYGFSDVYGYFEQNQKVVGDIVEKLKGGVGNKSTFKN